MGLNYQQVLKNVPMGAGGVKWNGAEVKPALTLSAVVFQAVWVPWVFFPAHELHSGTSGRHGQTHPGVLEQPR